MNDHVYLVIEGRTETYLAADPDEWPDDPAECFHLLAEHARSHRSQVLPDADSVEAAVAELMRVKALRRG